MADYSENPRTCIECGQDLAPNYMEGRWEHFAQGCKFTGMSQTSVPEGIKVMPVYLREAKFAGAFRNERAHPVTKEQSNG